MPVSFLQLFVSELLFPLSIPFVDFSLVMHAPLQNCASAILFSAENATKVALDTIQCLGGYGYMNEYGAGKLLADAKLYEIGAGTSEVRRTTIAKQTLKQVPACDV